VATEEALPVPVATCTVSPVNAGGANIRQSASLNAIVLGALPSGAFADVIGIAPDRSFYNVLYDGINGWIASSAVSAAGNCDNAPIVQPPQVVPLPLTATPIPPSPVPPMPTATQSGPCLIRMTGEALIYTQPTAGESNIYDEVQPGYELIPVGRLADNSWWQTNYAGAWIQTNLFGSVAQVSGNCSALPIVSP
jgi:hypothetical protein